MTEECHDHDCIHHEKLSGGLGGQLSGLTDNIHKLELLDSFVLNLLLTCHTHILDVFDILLTHVATRVKVTLASPDMQEP